MKKRKGFVVISEYVIILAIAGLVAIMILAKTGTSLKQSYDTVSQQKLQTDLWSNQ